ncbi:hypothetical protein FGG08_001624 [Glutinoglossum americanum]|uniref:DUS-like FMN-binding domain-containing protein n=1 Tax=Glutinoglossum americanum TaxID=1670608 RepID=A0A9P8I6H8_9PEZI|nr:hypothetical protein FGG08_001624 [Glutinoglossum americanum]
MLRTLTTAMDSVPKRVAIPKNGVDFRNKVVLAPMVRSGEIPTRLLALKYGADLVWGPETVDQSMIGTTRRLNPHTQTIEFTRLPSHGPKNPGMIQRESVIYRIHPARESRSLIFQLGTACPARAVEAAKLVAGYVAGIDVNAGCPKPFSTIGGMGAALLGTPDKLCAILEALVKEVGSEYEIGISVKIRILDTAEKTEALVRKLCQTGITGLTVHCRTRSMRPRERAIRDQLRMIGQVCREAGVACLMNGDVVSREQAEELAQEYGVDGVMIATAAEANPSCFRRKSDGGLVPWRDLARECLRTALEVDNKFGNTKFLLANLIPGKDMLHRTVPMAKSYREVCKILGLEEELGRQAREVDERVGIVYEKDGKDVKNAKLKNATARAAGGDLARKKSSPADGRNILAQRGTDAMRALTAEI